MHSLFPPTISTKFCTRRHHIHSATSPAPSPRPDSRPLAFLLVSKTGAASPGQGGNLPGSLGRGGRWAAGHGRLRHSQTPTLSSICHFQRYRANQFRTFNASTLMLFFYYWTATPGLKVFPEILCMLGSGLKFRVHVVGDHDKSPRFLDRKIGSRS